MLHNDAYNCKCNHLKYIEFIRSPQLQACLVPVNKNSISPKHSLNHILQFSTASTIITFQICNLVRVTPHIYLLWSELLRCWQILSVVVAKVIVAHDRRRLDAGAHEKVNEDRLYLCLSRFEVVAADEYATLLRQLNHSWNKRVLWTPVDVRRTLEDWRNGKQGRGWYLIFIATDRLEQCSGSVVQSGTNFTEALSVGSPQNYHLHASQLSTQF